MQLILASESPRRRELLALLGLEFTVVTSHVEERPPAGATPAETVRALSPDMEKLKNLPGLLQHATARGAEADCVSRSFAPKLAVPEDPVCGSGHCHIAPYWAERLGRRELRAYQASGRGGTLFCRVEGERVALSGEAALFAESELHI